MSKDKFIKGVEAAMDVIRETAMEMAAEDWDEMECQCERCQSGAEQAAIMAAAMKYISTELTESGLPHLADIVDRMRDGFTDASSEDTIGLTRSIGHFQMCIESVRMEITARTSRVAVMDALGGLAASAVQIGLSDDDPGDRGAKYQH